MSASTTSLTPTSSTFSIKTSDDGGSPISRALSKAKKRSTTNLLAPTNASSLSLSSNEAGSTKTSTSGSSVMDKIRKRRNERKERKENGGIALDDPLSNRRTSTSGSLGSEASFDAEDGLAITSEPGLVAAEPGSAPLPNTPTFPITISTSIESPAAIKARNTQLQVTPDGRPIRRSTSPNHSASSRDGSPTPGDVTRTPTLASGLVIGNIFGMNVNGARRNRSDTTTSNTSGSGSGPEDSSSTPTPRSTPSVPNLQVKAAASAGVTKDGVLVKPDTTVTPPTPIEPPLESPSKTSSSGTSSPPSTLGSRRRGASISKLPSKLSQSSFPDDRVRQPLTPTIEVPTPQQTPTVGAGGANGGPAGGFFGNLLNTAQNLTQTAASQLSNTIANNPLAKGKKGEMGEINTTLANNAGGSGEATPLQPSTPAKGAVDEKDRKPLAVETLGQGELSLGALGITGPTTESRERNGRRSRPNSKAGSDVDPTNYGLGLTGGDSGEIGQLPRSGGGLVQERTFLENLNDAARGSIIPPGGFSTPPQVPLYDDAHGDGAGRRRSDSVRSAIGRSNSRRKRERGASAATQGSDSTAAGGGVRTTTFAAANPRRNRDFHTLFKTVPSEDQLIEDYGCALQREILLQGRMYVSEGHICFNSNIFGWVTTLVISFNEIVAIERRNTAVVFPNAIMIQTLHARNVFASFISRDSTYDLILGIWRTSHPGLMEIKDGWKIGEGGAANGAAGEEDGLREDDESEYSDDDGSYSSAGGYSDASAGSEKNEPSATTAKIVSKKASSQPLGAATPGTAAMSASVSSSGIDGIAAAAGAAAAVGVAGVDFPGPSTHAPTTCGDETSHLDRALCDETIAAPLGRVYSTMFGDHSYAFLTRLLTEDEKVEGLNIPDEGKWKESAEYSGKKARSYNYVKPLNASIGPRSTKCLITEVIEQEDLEKAVTIATFTQTPDVPSGGVFKVLTRTCLMWGAGNGTRIIMNCTVEWSGKSWIKGPIEKGASDGQINYSKVLLEALKREFTTKLKTAGATGGAGGKGKRRKRGEKEAGGSSTTAAPVAVVAATPQQKWGLLAPLMEPITTLLGDFGAGMLVALAVFTLGMVISRAISGDSSGSSRGGGRKSKSLGKDDQRFLSELWQREEANIWEWLEDRSRFADAVAGGTFGSDTPFNERAESRYWLEKDAMMDGIRRQSGDSDPRMVERQVDEAIRVTEERLEVLRRVNEEKKAKRKEAEKSKNQGGGTGSEAKQKAGCEKCGYAGEGHHQEPLGGK